MSAESPQAEDRPSGFTELGLKDRVLEGLDLAGYEAPSPVQAATFPHLMKGTDLLGQAQTGTGKTAAFALPILSKVDIKRREPQALVLVPTRELAIQVAEAFKRYAARVTAFSVLPIYGGQAYERQLRPLKRGVHVVVGTPGRVMDHMRQGSLKLETLSMLVLDEADEMLRMGFIQDVEWILEQSPDALQIALFSATLPDPIRRIAQRHLKQPATVTIEPRAKAATSIRQRYCVVGGNHKLEALTRIFEAEPCEASIVFVRTKTATVELAEKLEARGYGCAPLNGDIPQALRARTVERLKSGHLDILVATDVAARGLDVQRVSHVINFDIPHDAEGYVHRIGRTGRAGKSGEAILFVTPRERRMLRTIEKSLEVRIEQMVMPSTDEVNSRRIARFKQRISDALGVEELPFFTRIVEEYRQQSGTPMDQIAGALAVLAKGDQPFLLPDDPAPQRAAREHKKPDRARAPEGERNADEGMGSYRIEIGRQHGARHSAIVGAIANQGGVPGKHIGRIRILEDHSIVDLPARLPRSVFLALKNTSIRRRLLRISPLRRSSPSTPR